MSFTKISPLGPRVEEGTFETFFDGKKYHNMALARAANDMYIVDFVQDQNGIIYFEGYSLKQPELKTYHKLNYQHFPAGIDVSDDAAACAMADKYLES